MRKIVTLNRYGRDLEHGKAHGRVFPASRFRASPGQVAWVELKPARPPSMEVFEETDRHLMSGVGIRPDLRSLAGRTCVAPKPTLIFRGGRSGQ